MGKIAEVKIPQSLADARILRGNQHPLHIALALIGVLHATGVVLVSLARNGEVKAVLEDLLSLAGVVVLIKTKVRMPGLRRSPKSQVAAASLVPRPDLELRVDIVGLPAGKVKTAERQSMLTHKPEVVVELLVNKILSEIHRHDEGDSVAVSSSLVEEIHSQSAAVSEGRVADRDGMPAIPGLRSLPGEEVRALNSRARRHKINRPRPLRRQAAQEVAVSGARLNEPRPFCYRHGLAKPADAPLGDFVIGVELIQHLPGSR
ncbi:MAG: hypothetical protein MPJ22_00565 [Pirellulales bacterium]|nr:hypothetical protein [Pirellulales bacterium]